MNSPKRVAVLPLFLILLCTFTARAQEQVIYNFGSAPNPGLVIDPQGNLYGLNNGVFELVHGADGSWTPKSISDLASNALIIDSQGNLYGNTGYGGTNGAGEVFELSPNSDGSWTTTVLYNFRTNTQDGSQGTPSSGLFMDKSGAPDRFISQVRQKQRIRD
jgi:uncharacterized repeat protein (TIGR03803 family)